MKKYCWRYEKLSSNDLGILTRHHHALKPFKYKRVVYLQYVARKFDSHFGITFVRLDIYHI